MTQPLTVNDVQDAIWAHTINITSVAVAGKGSVRITAWLAPEGNGIFTSTYKVITKLSGKPREDVNFNQQELVQAVTLYNSIVHRL